MPSDEVSGVGAATGDLSWQPRLCRVPMGCSHRSPAKVGAGTGYPCLGEGNRHSPARTTLLAQNHPLLLQKVFQTR